MSLRQRFYVDPEIQFPIILSLILLVTAQGFFVGWGFSKAIAVARQWQRPEQAAEFFTVLLLTVIPVVALNFALGTWISHKFAGPLLQMRRALGEVARGNLEVEVRIRSGDFLHAHAQELNRAVSVLRKLIYRDQGYAREADEVLLRCQERLSRSALADDEKRQLKVLLDDAKSRLSIINAHFSKGKWEERP